MATVYLFLRKDIKKLDGRSTVYLRYKDHKQTKKDISLRISLFYDDWNELKKEAIRGSANYKEINRRLNLHITRARNILLEAEMKNKMLTADEFQRLFTNRPDSDDFIEYARIETDRSVHKFSPETIKYYKGQISKVQKFRKKFNIQDIDLEFIRNYEKYMVTVLGNQTNTYSKTMAWIKAILNRAIKEGIIERNPFINYKMVKAPGKREFLTIEEVRKLEGMMNSNDLDVYEKNVLQYFLFSCYTGLRYRDIKELRFKDLVNGMIRMKMHKTKSEVTIPLIEKAKVMIDDDAFEYGYVFARVLSNQKTNEYLKVIMKKAGITKSISFHCARHTFATIGITLGIPIEVISKLLGHGDLRTTQIYAKIVDNVKISEMAKWDSI